MRKIAFFPLNSGRKRTEMDEKGKCLKLKSLQFVLKFDDKTGQWALFPLNDNFIGHI